MDQGGYKSELARIRRIGQVCGERDKQTFLSLPFCGCLAWGSKYDQYSELVIVGNSINNVGDYI